MKFLFVLIILISIAMISGNKIIDIAKEQVSKIEFRVDEISRELNIANY